MENSRTDEIVPSRLPRTLYVVMPIVAIVFFAIVLAPYFIRFAGPLAIEQEKWGQFGDYIGGVLNPILSFLGLIALLSTVALQSKELQLSTQEMAKSASALNLQNTAMAQQNFESTLFQLLRRYGELVSETRYNNASGREAFRLLYMERLRDASYGQMRSITDLTNRVTIAYGNFYTERRHELAHYFRTLFHIFRFIDTSNFNDAEKYQYASIARAQLSTYELCLLFYNALCGEGKEGFKPLIEKYALLKHISDDDLLDKSDRTNSAFFSADAFMGRKGRDLVDKTPP